MLANGPQSVLSFFIFSSDSLYRNCWCTAMQCGRVSLLNVLLHSCIIMPYWPNFEEKYEKKKFLSLRKLAAGSSVNLLEFTVTQLFCSSHHCSQCSHNPFRLIGVGLSVWTFATAGCGSSFDFWSIAICRM